MPYARNKRIVFWSSLIIAAGATVGTYFFPPLFPLPLTTLIILMGSYYSLESELQRKISHYEKPIDLQELISSPVTNPNPTTIENKTKKNYKNRSEERTDISDKAWAEYILFDNSLNKAKEKSNDFGSGITDEFNVSDRSTDNMTSHSISDVKDNKTAHKP